MQVRALGRAEDLRADYDRLGILLEKEDDGSKAAALARERRLLGDLVEALKNPEAPDLADELAERRRRSEDPGPTSRRRRPG